MKHHHSWLAVGAIALVGCTPSNSDTDLLEDEAAAASDSPFANGPMYLTGAFDGSKAFRMWNATMQFTRDLERDTGKHLRFTYFINTAYFDTGVRGSWIGKSLSDKESLVRMAVTQQAINEGHEIANHTVRHQDGSQWTELQWRAELEEFHALTDKNLFRPVLGDDGKPVFPRWRAMPGAAPGEVGSACSNDSDCQSSMCLDMAPGQGICSAACNKNRPCGNGTVCGASDWNESLDRCIPVPEFPVVHKGEVLFDANGAPNLSSSQLEPYQIVGFRAPQLGHNQALFEILEELGYRYDTSKILRPGPPTRVSEGRSFPSIYEFALMKHEGAKTIPMDYNYKVNDGSGERMTEDYKSSVRAAYADGRQPWNVGHHFSLWLGGAYWQAMKDTFVYAAKGCPENGELKCPNVEFPTFVELADTLDGMNASRGGGLDDASDLFARPGVEEDATFVTEMGCGDDDDQVEGLHSAHGHSIRPLLELHR